MRRSPVLLDSGALDLGIVKSVLSISDFDPDDDAEMTEEVSSILTKAFEAHAADTPSSQSLRQAADELNELVERLNHRRQ